LTKEAAEGERSHFWVLSFARDYRNGTDQHKSFIFTACPFETALHARRSLFVVRLPHGKEQKKAFGVYILTAA
jgi:hypothetical protein